MTDSPTSDEALVTETARVMLDRIGVVEPEQVAAERRVFDVLRMAYFANPARALTGDDGGGQLSFGPPGVEELLTPVLMAAAAEVVRYLADRGVVLTRAGVRRVLGRPADTSSGADSPVDTPPSAAPLTREQWREVREIVMQALVRHGRMSPHRAALIAAAAVGDGTTGQEPE
ncbi:hypothetical protein [Micromonospora chokoriensis]|uniref:Uncharacterized protein n=1 Tax=Micromonospora chokoriensis TaxID=356851 RepID=A0A1C4YRM1_9ACTN|nr:hypothetical protein [Micromonospora chokoriensis]SCF23399.1 hypothetical protein GA0070612_5143 [Micromonospora chokoriensis]